MCSQILDIKHALTKYDLHLSGNQVNQYLDAIQTAQQYFPVCEQRALIIKLLCNWEASKNQKIIVVTSEACNIKGSVCVTTFGILSVDWPGLFDSCAGVIHEMGWNIYFIKGISLIHQNENLGIILIGVMTDKDDTHQSLIKQKEIIQTKIHQAAVGTSAKTALLSEEIRKIEIYSQVITHIETMVTEDNLEQIIGMNGEAVKFFAARSRDYLENRQPEDIARQILLNYTFMQRVHKTGKTIELDIHNFETKKEGTFTGVTVAGPATLLNLEDCLKTIELTNPHYHLKHNREFTTEHGISLFRIELVDSSSHALSELEQSRLRKAFNTLVLNKRRNRAQWIETIGGFEQYARAIIPLLVKEAQSTGKTQVYISVGHATDLFIDFKVIVVAHGNSVIPNRLVSATVNQLEAVPNIHIQRVKPPKRYGETQVFIVDLRVNISEMESTETMYRIIKEKVYSALGEFRDFDEGMRTIDTTKLKSIRRRLRTADKNTIRELYYSIEDFYRVGASEHEIIAHIRIALQMLKKMDTEHNYPIVLSSDMSINPKNGHHLTAAHLFCIAYPHSDYLLQEILKIFESFEVTLSRLQKTGWDIFICRVTKNDKALSEADKKTLVKKLKALDITNNTHSKRSTARGGGFKTPGGAGGLK